MCQPDSCRVWLGALPATPAAEQAALLKTLLEAVEIRYRVGCWQFTHKLAALLPEDGPAVVRIAGDIEARVDLTPGT